MTAFILFKRRNLNLEGGKSGMIPEPGKALKLTKEDKHEIMIKFEDLRSLSTLEESQLVEIKDKTLLAKIDTVVSGTLRTIANTGAAKASQDLVKEVGKLYRAIIPKNAELFQSRGMQNTFRGAYHMIDSGKVAGQANFVQVDSSAAGKMATANAMNAAMSVASIVVGLYFLTLINDKLKGIASGIEKIADFQHAEYRGKVYALVAEVQKASTFQMEILESSELRNRELMHLQSLEHECAQLLGQANLSLQNIVKKTDISYSEYEKLVAEAEVWYQYQNVILEVMYKISDLTYAMNLGAISRENSYALYLPYADQSESTLGKLNEWHNANADRLKIDTSKKRVKRQGVEGVLWSVGGLAQKINDDLNYRKIHEETLKQIEHQTANNAVLKPSDDSDLYQKEVTLIAKDGKLYYLPDLCKSET